MHPSLAHTYTRALRKLLGQRLVSVVLFGSVARRQARPDSDIDLIVIVEGLPQGSRARQETLSPAFTAQIDRLVLVSRHLRADREPVGAYGHTPLPGDEERGISPQELYNQVDAQQALDDLAFVFEQVQRLLSEDH